MNKLEYVYNLGLRDDLLNSTLTQEKYQAKLESNHALQANLNVLSKQVNLLKSFSNSTVTNLESFSQILDSLCLCLLKRNAQAYNYKLNKLTKYGERINIIRNNIYEGQNTEKGFLGTLLIYQTGNQQDVSLNNYIESILINYWKSLEIDYLKSPRDRFKIVLSEVGLRLDTEYYQTITEQILTLIESNSIIKKKFSSLLLDYLELDNLLLTLITLELDTNLDIFLRWLYDNEYIDIDFGDIIDKLIRYQPIGGVILVLLSFLVEGLALASRYIKDLPSIYKNLSIEKFTTLEETKIYSQEIANYLALSFDAIEWLQPVFEEFDLLKEAMLADLVKFIKEPIIAKGTYRLDV